MTLSTISPREIVKLLNGKTHQTAKAEPLANEKVFITDFDNVVAHVKPLPRWFGLGTDFVILLQDRSVLQTNWLTGFEPADLAVARAGDRLWFSVAPGGKLLKVRVIARQVQGELTESLSGFTGHNRI